MEELYWIVGGIAAIGAVVALRVLAGVWDGQRVDDYLRERGGALLSKQWTPFGPGWFGSEHQRIYGITYRDAEGNTHRAYVKTSMLSGVYLHDDTIVEYAESLPDELAAPYREPVPASAPRPDRGGAQPIHPKRLGAVVLSVRDVEASLAWYRERLGFERLYDDAPNSPGVVIGTGDAVLVLNPLAEPETAAPVDTARQVCVQLFCLEVDAADLDRVAAEFPEDDDIVVLDDHPRYRSRIVEDPDGHAIELFAWK